jgi:CRP-like cAMP-binding protein
MTSRVGWGLEHMSTDTFCSRRPSCALARMRRVVDLGGPPVRFHIALISELVCHGLTLWEFRPLVQENGAIGWKLVQTLAKELRAAEQALAGLRSSSPEARGSAG